MHSLMTPCWCQSGADTSDTINGLVVSIMSSQMVNVSSNTGARDKVQIFELLGTGGTAKVYRGLWKGVVVAYKVMQLPPARMEREQQKMAMEMGIAAALRHPNVVQTFKYEINPMAAPSVTCSGVSHTFSAAATDLSHVGCVSDLGSRNFQGCSSKLVSPTATSGQVVDGTTNSQGSDLPSSPRVRRDAAVCCV